MREAWFQHTDPGEFALRLRRGERRHREQAQGNVTRHPTVLDHMIVSLRGCHTDLLLPLEVKPNALGISCAPPRRPTPPHSQRPGVRCNSC